MKLYYSPTSPYARKVRVIIRELGLTGMVDEIVANSMEEGAAELIGNPLSKVPCLITDAGEAIYDSPVICAYLHDLSESKGFLPDGGADHWSCRRREALGDGVLDAAFQTVMETRRPDAEPSAHWLKRWNDAIERSLGQMQIDVSVSRYDLGDITYVCALGYLDFRLGELNWAQRYPALSAWYERLASRQSFKDTQPPA